MGLLDVLKRGRKKKLPLPPPPKPRKAPGSFGDIEPIRPPANLLPPPPVDDHSEEKIPEGLPEVPVPPKLPLLKETRSVPEKLPSIPPLPRQVAPEKAETPALAPLEREEVRKPEVPARSFIAVDDYKRILGEINNIRARLVNADKYVRQLTVIKNDEERILQRWVEQLEDVEKKLSYVDQVIESAQR